MKQQCKNCKYWENDDHSVETPECRRYAPRCINSRYGDRWMCTLAYDWCGEFKPKK